MSLAAGLEREAHAFALRVPTPAAERPAAVAPAAKPSAVRRQVPGGSVLDRHHREMFESSTGVDLSDVRVHPMPGPLARTLTGVNGFTTGRDVVLRHPVAATGPIPGRLLAHEIAHVVQQAGGSRGAGLSAQHRGREAVVQGDDNLEGKKAAPVRDWLAGGGWADGPTRPQQTPLTPLNPFTVPLPWDKPAPPRQRSVPPCNANCHQTPQEQADEADRRREEARKAAEEAHQARLRKAWPSLHAGGNKAELDKQAGSLSDDISTSRSAETQLRLKLFDQALAADQGILPGSASALTKQMRDSWQRAEQSAALLAAIFRAGPSGDVPAALVDPLRPSFVAFYASVSSWFRRRDTDERKFRSKAPERIGPQVCPGGCHQPSPGPGSPGGMFGSGPQAPFGPFRALELPGMPPAQPLQKPEPLIDPTVAGPREMRLGRAVTAVEEAAARGTWVTVLDEFRWATRELDIIVVAEARQAGAAATIEQFEFTIALRERQEKFFAAHPTALKVQAVFYPKEDVSEQADAAGATKAVARAIPWHFYLTRTQVTDSRYVPTGYTWELHDITAPRRDGNQRTVRTSEQLNQLEALTHERFDPKPIDQMPVPRKLFEELNHKDFFPEGHLYYRDPVTQSPGDVAMTAETTFFEWLRYIGMGVAILGSLVFAPLSTPFIAAALLGTGLALAGSYGRLQEKKAHGVWTQEDDNAFYSELAQDVLAVATLGIGRLGVVVAEAGNLARASSAVRVWFTLRRIEAGVSLVNIGITTHDTLKQYLAIEAAIKSGAMTKAQGEAAYRELAMSTVVSGAFAIAQFRGAIKDLTGKPALRLSPDPANPGRYIASLDVVPGGRLKATADVSSEQLAKRPVDLEREFAVVKVSPKRRLSGGEYEEEAILDNGHVWRRTKEGRWCRFSDDPMCFVFGEAGGHSVQSFRSKRAARQGEWDGEPGFSNFTPNDPATLRLLGFRPIPYRGGYPVFVEFAEATVVLSRAQLAIKDRALHDRLADASLARQRGWWLPGTNPRQPDVATATAFRTNPANPFTWHHVEGDNIMQLVPRLIHRAAQHAGGFAED